MVVGPAPVRACVCTSVGLGWLWVDWLWRLCGHGGVMLRLHLGMVVNDIIARVCVCGRPHPTTITTTTPGRQRRSLHTLVQWPVRTQARGEAAGRRPIDRSTRYPNALAPIYPCLLPSSPMPLPFKAVHTRPNHRGSTPSPQPPQIRQPDSPVVR